MVRVLARRRAFGRRCACEEVDGAVRHRFLATSVDSVTQDQLLADVDGAACQGRSYVTANHNINSLALLQRNADFRDYYEAAHRTFIDGTLIVLVGRLLGHDLELRHRIAALDYLSPLCRLAVARNWRLVHVGGGEPWTSAARARLEELHPGLDLIMISGFFDANDAAASRSVMADVNAARPDVLLVGMGMPRQELWLAANAQELPRCPVLTVGGMMSFVGGERPTPPRWLGRIGLEWSYRLATEPRRLWRRYLIEPAVLLRPMIEEWRRSRQTP